MGAPFRWSFSYSGHPGVDDRLKGFQIAQAVMKGAEIHVVYAHRNSGVVRLRLRHPDHCALTMNALLPETMICGQLYLYSDNLPDRGNRQRRPIAAPRNQQAAATDVL